MDDFTIVDERLTGALEQLRWVNRLLGGYATTMTVLGPYLRRNRHRQIRLLDLGTGVADYPEYLVRWARRVGIDLRVTAVDANPVTVSVSNATLDARLPSNLRKRIDVLVGDALQPDFASASFHVVTAAMFMHHFEHDQAVQMLRRMKELASDGILINDLHRHPLAYYSIKTIASLFPVSEMFRHDAPLSVLRSFKRAELIRMADDARLESAVIRWHWAFRWSLSTIT